MKQQNPSSLLAKYKYLYERNPRSKVFAPLAEAYRKIGLYDEGVKILRDGIKYHPNYILAYIVLAHIYYDQEYYELAYSTVRSFVAQNLENISLQKLFGNICLRLEKLDEALETFKLLLLLNPRDEEVEAKVAELEEQLNHSVIVEDRRESVRDFFDDQDDWVQVDFNTASVVEEKDTQGNWSLKQPGKLVDFESIEVKDTDLSSDFYLEEYDVEQDDVITAEDDHLIESEEADDSEKIVSHSLVDLYYSQGHLEKALSLLEEIKVKVPDDEKTLKKIEAIQNQLDQDKNLDDVLDSVDEIESKNLKLVATLQKFLEEIRAEGYRREDTHS